MFLYYAQRALLVTNKQGRISKFKADKTVDQGIPHYYFYGAISQLVFLNIFCAKFCRHLLIAKFREERAYRGGSRYIPRL